MEENERLWKKIFHKSKIYPIVLLLLCYAVYKYRNRQVEEQTPQQELINGFVYNNGMCTIEGETMGHIPFTIKYIADNRNYEKEIKNLLIDFNQTFSTYIPESEISIFNQSDFVCNVSERFLFVLAEAKKIARNTNNYFDPTVMPLVNAWGFGYKKPQDTLPSSGEIDSIMLYVGVDKLTVKDACLYKTHPKLQLDFSAIAKGYASDVVAKFLDGKNIHDYMVEIGGEVVCKGKNSKKKTWRIGIEEPNQSKRSVVLAIPLHNKAIATSGNYRNFYQKEGKKYGHTINPHTGKVAATDMLSVSVIANTCLEADAYATAFMAMGATKAIKNSEQRNDLEVYFIYSDKQELKQYKSQGFEKE